MNKLCIITPRLSKYYRDAIPKDIEYVFAQVGGTFDRNCQVLRLREHAPTTSNQPALFLMGSDIGPYIDVHEILDDIPENRFVYASMCEKRFRFKDFDYTYMCIIEDDFTDALAVRCYMERTGIDPDKVGCIRISEVDEKGHLRTAGPAKEWLASAYSHPEKLPSYVEIYQFMYDREKGEGFESHLPITRNIWYLINESGMNNKEFAEFMGTNVRNVENWKAKPESLADYIYDLFEYKLIHEGII